MQTEFLTTTTTVGQQQPQCISATIRFKTVATSNNNKNNKFKTLSHVGTVASRPRSQEARLTINNDPSGGPADVKQRPGPAPPVVAMTTTLKVKSTPTLPVNQINKNNDDRQGWGILKYKKFNPSYSGRRVEK